MQKSRTSRSEAEIRLEAASQRVQRHAEQYVALSKFNLSLADLFFSKKYADLKKIYYQANEDLRQIERADNFVNIKGYVSVVSKLARAIPISERKMGYYPFAGIDIFWSACFPELVLLDENFDTVEENRTNWWSVADYQTQALTRLQDELKKQGIIPVNNKITFKAENAQKDLMVDNFNQSCTTLIYKGGDSFIPFIEKNFKTKQVNYGAVIITNDYSSGQKINKLMSERGYKKVYEIDPPKIANPWALTLSDCAVFLKV